MLSLSNEQLQVEIASRLQGNFNVLVFDELDSTNNKLKSLADDGASAGTIVIARRQTAGRGTQGRKFYSPLNGLYMSMLVKPNFAVAESASLTVATAVAVVDAIKAVLKIKCGIKWVNDIFYQNKKVGGILTEGEIATGTQMLKSAVVGIGLNLATPEQEYPPAIRQVAGALLTADKLPDCYCTLVAEIVNRAYRLFSKVDKNNYLKKYQKYSILKGKKIQLVKNGQAYTGKVQGIDAKARLVVKLGKAVVKLSAGEVAIVQ